MKFHVTVTLYEGDELYEHLKRLTFRGDKSAKALKRALTRYVQMIATAEGPPSQLLRLASQAIMEKSPGLVGQVAYPTKSELIKVVQNSSLLDKEINYVKDTIDGMTFSQYARLIEAIELMYVGK